MKVDIISCVPEILDGIDRSGVISRAKKKGLVEVTVHDLRDYGQPPHRQVDDYPYGGGPGMILMIEPIDKCLSSLLEKGPADEIILLTPEGKTLDQKDCNELSMCHSMIILCGHYLGVDERINQLGITRKISLGDFVLSGGEPAAFVLCDAVVRLIPGVLNDSSNVLEDSFQQGGLACPHYTRPADYKGWKVPGPLLSGNRSSIVAWREEASVKRTRECRPDLMREEHEDRFA